MGNAQTPVLETSQAGKPMEAQWLTPAPDGAGPVLEPAHDWARFGRDLAGWVQRAVAWCGPRPRP